MPRLPIPTCSLAFLSLFSDVLGVAIPDHPYHPSKDRCQGCSSATVVLDHITSQGFLARWEAYAQDDATRLDAGGPADAGGPEVAP